MHSPLQENCIGKLNHPTPGCVPTAGAGRSLRAMNLLPASSGVSSPGIHENESNTRGEIQRFTRDLSVSSRSWTCDCKAPAPSPTTGEIGKLERHYCEARRRTGSQHAPNLFCHTSVLLVFLGFLVLVRLHVLEVVLIWNLSQNAKKPRATE